MKIEIKTPFAEMIFEMGQQQVVSLLKRAMEYAVGGESVEPCHQPPADPVVSVATRVDPEIDHYAQAGARGSRVEKLFGNRTDWGTKRAEGRPDPNEVGYTGLLYIYCEGCGQERGYHAKTPETKHKCKCGYHTRLQDLMPIYAKCKCGSEFKYKTNIETDVLTMDCLNCGAPIDLAMNSRRTAFVTVGGSDER